MKNLFYSALFLALTVGVFVSCRRDEIIDKLGKSCQVVSLKEFESSAPSGPNAVPYKENSFIYEDSSLVRITTRTRGTEDGYRIVNHEGKRISSVLFYDKDNLVNHRYTFNYYQATDRLESVAIRYDRMNPVVNARYLFEYTNNGKLGKVRYEHNGSITQLIEYEQKENTLDETILATIYEVRASDPSFKLKVSTIEYVFDSLPSADIWPAFSWNQFHQAKLDFLKPYTGHNLKSYTHRILRSRSETIPVFEVDSSISFTSSIDYTAEGYPSTYIENRLRGYTLKYEYTYSNCAK